MLHYFHVAMAETTRRPVTVDVTLSFMVKDRVCTTIRLKRAIDTARKRFVHTRVKELTVQSSCDKRAMRCRVDRTQLKGGVTHLREHSRFIRRVNQTIVVVDQNTVPAPAGDCRST